MTAFVLYLHLFGFGWIEFESFSSLDECEKVRIHIVEGRPERLEGLCLAVKK